MNKTTIFLVLLLIISCNNKEKLTPNEKKGLYGKIKAYKEIFLSKNTQEQKEPFDTIQKMEYVYNSRQKVKKIKKWIRLNDKIFIKTTTFDFDHKDRIIKEITKTVSINDTISNIQEWVYSYNKNNEIFKIVSSSKNEKIASNETYEYFYQNEHELKKIEYNDVRVLLSTNDTFATKSIELYNKKGLPETTYHIFTDSDEKHIDTITIKQEYNKKNLCSKITNIGIDKEPTTETFKYEYDDNGSWILQKGYFNDKLVEKVIREIEYK